MKFDYIELAWAAGFFDGKGWFGSRPNKDYGFVMGIGQKDIRPLYRFINALNLDINIHQVHSPYIYTIILSGSKAFDATLKLWTYLSYPKKEQALISFKKAYDLRSRRFKKLNEKYDKMKIFFEEQNIV
jgi:hypothetical protein